MGLDSGCLLTVVTAGPCSSYMLSGNTTTFNQQNAQSCSLDVYIIISRLIFLCFGSQGTIVGESNIVISMKANHSLLYTAEWCKSVMWLKFYLIRTETCRNIKRDIIIHL